MSKHVPDAVLDTFLAAIAVSTRLDIVSDSSTPTGLTNSLAYVAMIAGDGNGDYTFAAGAVSGRKLTTTQKSGILINVGGTPRHVVLSLAGVIKYVTTCTGADLVQNNTVTAPAFTVTVSEVA